MKAIIEINILGLKGTMFKVDRFENGLYYIKVPFLQDWIMLTFSPSQVTIFN